MAIKEFVIGPQNYFEGDYFAGDYTLTNISKSYLQCDIDNIKGGRVVTGEYFQDNYIDGTYWHSNSIKAELVAEGMIVQEAVISMQQYYQEGYYSQGYYQERGSIFTMTAELERVGQDVFASGDFTVSTTIDITTSVIKDCSASLTVETSVNAILSNINGADLFAFSEAALAAQAEVIRETNIELSTQFDVATTAVRGIYVSAQADSYVDVFSAGNINAGLEAATTAAFSMTVDVGYIQEASCDITAAFTPTLTIDVFKNSFAVLDSTTSLFANFDITKTTSISISCNFTETISARKLKSFDSNLQINFSLSASYLSFVNKRPRSLYMQSGLPVFNSTIKKFGTHSADIYGRTLYIPTTNNNSKIQNIAVNEDFYVSVWINTSIVYPFHRTGFNSFIDAGSWKIGTYSNFPNGYDVAAVQYYNGTSYVTLTSGYENMNSGDWIHYELSRKNGVISYTHSWLAGGRWSSFTRTSNYSGALTTTKTSITSASPYTQYLYIDEFFYAKGVGSVQTYMPSGEIDDGSLTTTQFLYRFDNNLYDTMTGTQKASANISSQVNLTAVTENRVRDQSANIQSQGFLVAAAGRIRPFADIEVAAFELTSAANVIRSLDSVQQSEFTQTTEATRNIGPVVIRSNCDTILQATNSVIAGGKVNLTAFATTLAAFGRIRPEVADLQSAFTMQTKVEAGKIAFADFDVSSNLAAVATKQFGNIQVNAAITTALTARAVAIPAGGVNMPAEFVQTTQGSRIRYNQAAISADTATTADGDVIRRLNGNLDSYVNAEINPLRIKQLQGNFSAFFAELAITSKIGDFLVDCAVDTTLTVDASVKQANSATLETTTQLAAQTDVTKSYQAALAVTAFELVVADTGLIGAADLVAITELTAAVDVTTSANANLTTASELTCRLDAVRDGISIEMIFGTLDITANRTRDTECRTTVIAEVTVQAGKIEQLSASLQVEGFVLAIGKVINLQASETYIVPRDDYGWIVPKETRSYRIERETRTYIIEGI